MNNKVFVGIVEDRNDPLKIGRCKVRVIGLHTDDKTLIPTEDLPWAVTLIPTHDGGTSGIGASAVGPPEGTSVAIQFLDPDELQHPVMIGAIPTIPQSEATSLLSTDNIFLNGGIQNNAFGEAVSSLLGSTNTVVSSVNDTISAINGVESAVTNEFNNIINAAEKAVEDCANSIIKELEEAALAAAKEQVGKLVSGALAEFPDISAITGAFESLAKIAGGIKDEVTGAINGILSTEKSVSNTLGSLSCSSLARLTTTQMMSVMEKRDGSKGFCDPNTKYPLRDHTNEQTTNRLARGFFNGTLIEYTDANRTVSIPRANSKETWDEPEIVHDGQYPYTHVHETESGHVSIKNNAPGFEAITDIHRKGSYITTDPNGSRVTKIVGDGYVIIDRNGQIYVAGKCDITVGNECNVLVQGAANLQVYGCTNAIFHNKVNIAVSKDVNMKVGGNFTLDVDGNTAINTSGTFTVKSKGELAMISSNKIGLEAKSDFNLKGMNVSAEASGILSLKSTGITHIDGSNLLMQQGGAKSVNALNKSITMPLIKPAESDGAGNKFKPLQVTARKQE